jgi:hypothetical protein
MTKKSSNVPAFLFDLDGTLITCWRGEKRSSEAAFRFSFGAFIATVEWAAVYLSMRCCGKPVRSACQRGTSREFEKVPRRGLSQTGE